MYRGRGGRPYPLHGVRPVQMKPGRGRPPSYGGYGGRPEPLMAAAAGWQPMAVHRPYGPRPMMRGMGPRPPPFAAPMRGRGGPPSRGRGSAPGAAGRGRAASRSRGGRGRGRGRGTEKTQKPAEKSGDAANSRNKSEREKDAVAMCRPWVTEALKAEILKKHELQDLSLKTKSDKDFEAFKEQRSKVAVMLRAAKLEYIGSQDEQDVDKIMAEARLKSKEILAAEAKAASSTAKSENGTSEGSSASNAGDTPAAPVDTANAASNGNEAIKSDPDGDKPVKSDPDGDKTVKAESTDATGAATAAV